MSVIIEGFEDDFLNMQNLMAIKNKLKNTNGDVSVNLEKINTNAGGVLVNKNALAGHLADFGSPHKVTLDQACDENSVTNQVIKTEGYKVKDDLTYIDKDISGNMTFTDTITGTRTLKNVGCPVHLFIKATGQAEGDLHLSGANWGVSKAIIYVIRVMTIATDWDLYLLQNDNGFVADDANIPKMQIVNAGNGNVDVFLSVPFEDEDASNEVHLYAIDNIAANTFDIYVLGTELI